MIAMINPLNPGRFDLSRNAFHIPGNAGVPAGYYNPMADLIVIEKTAGNTMIDRVLSLEAAHKYVAFTPMHCYMRAISLRLYERIIEISHQHGLVSGSPVETPWCTAADQVLLHLLDLLTTAIAPVQEVYSLSCLVNNLKADGVSSQEISDIEAKYASYEEHNCRIPIPNFVDLYRRFRLALEYMGPNYGAALCVFALSCPLPYQFCPINASCGRGGEVLSVGPGPRVAHFGDARLKKPAHYTTFEEFSLFESNDVRFRPRARLEYLLSAIEASAAVGTKPGTIQELDESLGKYLENRHGWLLRRGLFAKPCKCGKDCCFLNAIVQTLSPESTGHRVCSLWMNMCRRWEAGDAAADTMPWTPSVEKERLRGAYPSQIRVKGEWRAYKEHDDLDLLLFLEGNRQQMSARTELRCQCEEICELNPLECNFLPVLQHLSQVLGQASIGNGTRERCCPRMSEANKHARPGEATRIASRREGRTGQ